MTRNKGQDIYRKGFKGKGEIEEIGGKVTSMQINKRYKNKLHQGKLRK